MLASVVGDAVLIGRLGRLRCCSRLGDRLWNRRRRSRGRSRRRAQGGLGSCRKSCRWLRCVDCQRQRGKRWTRSARGHGGSLCDKHIGGATGKRSSKQQYPERQSGSPMFQLHSDRFSLYICLRKTNRVQDSISRRLYHKAKEGQKYGEVTSGAICCHSERSEESRRQPTRCFAALSMTD